MRIKREHDTGLEGPIYQEMMLLSEVERTPRASQRNLAKRIGVSLGVASLVMRQLVEKGYVRAQRAGWRTWMYTLTPGGLSRKAELTVAYLLRFLDHFEHAKNQLREELSLDTLHAETKIAVYGKRELCQLVHLALKDLGIDHVDVFHVNESISSDVEDVVKQSLPRAILVDNDYDRIVLAYLTDSEEESRNLLDSGIAPDKLLTLFGLPGEHQRMDPHSFISVGRHV